MAENGNGKHHHGRHLSLVASRESVGTVEIMGENGTPRTVAVWPLSIGAQEDFLTYIRSATEREIPYLEQLKAVQRILADCMPDATAAEIGKLSLQSSMDIVLFAQTTGNEVEQSIAERRAKANPQTPAGQTRKGRKAKA